MSGKTDRTSGAGPQETMLALFAFVLCVLVAATFGTSARDSRSGLPGDNGVAIVAAEALDSGEVFALDGPWQMYWNRFVAPSDLIGGAAPEPDGELLFPGSWRGADVAGEQLAGTGWATFRLRLLLPPGERALTVRLFDLRVAYRLWIDGALVAQSGVLGMDLSSERPDRSLILAPFETPGGAVQLVLQLSNHSFRAGGVGAPILLAKRGVLEAERSRGWVVAGLLCGVLVMAGIYHLMLHALRPREVSFLYFGIYALLLCGYAANSNTTEWLSRPIVPAWVTTAALDEVSLICYAVSGATLFRFYRSLYPEDFSRRLRVLSDARLPFFILSEVVLPPEWRSWAIVGLMLIGLTFSAYFLVRLVVCVRKRRPGSLLLLCGALLFAVTVVHDVFAHAGVEHGRYLVLYGLFALVVFQSSALALRHARDFRTIEALSGDLTSNVAALRAEIAKRRELESEIVRAGEDERRRISHQLHDGLCQQLTAARLRFSMLGARDRAETVSAMTELGALLSAAAGDAYALSRGLWPAEHGAAEPGPTLEELIGQVVRGDDISIRATQTWPCGTCETTNLRVLHRIAQEAITNAVKHAEATRIDVALGCDGSRMILLEVADDGAGRAAAPHAARTGGLGMRIMEHRAHSIGGVLTVADAPGGGTVVRCRTRCARRDRSVERT